MKNNKILALIGLIFLNVIAGYLVASVVFGGANKFDNTVKKAQEYCEQKLYQKSVEEYDKALAIKDSPEICIEQLNVYDAGIEYGELDNSYDLKTKLDSIMEKYYKNASVYETVCNLCLKNEDYESCVQYLKQAKSQKVKTDALDEIFEKVRYTYKNEYTMYEKVSCECNGDYLVETNGMVSILDTAGENVIPGTYKWATHFSTVIKIDGNEVKFAIVSKFDNESNLINYIVDVTGRKQIYVDQQLTGAYQIASVSDGKTSKCVFPGQIGDKHYYYSFNPVTEKVEQISGPYLFAGAYRNNYAAVQTAENEWQIIDGSGNSIGTTFSDVVLNDAGECAPKGLIIAAVDGKYQIYKINDKGKVEKSGDFVCEGAKAFVDGSYAAFKQGDKWGFVDKDGKVIIEPKYEDARSFSQGMAAVSIEGKWKFINESDAIVINEDFDSANDFGPSGKCFVESKNFWTSLQLYYVEDKK